MRIFFGILLTLHGLVHIWFIVLNQNLIKFEEKMGWTGKSWLLSDLISNPTLKTITTILLSISTLLFIIGAILFLFKSDYSKTYLIIAAIVSSLTLIVFWDGSFEMIVQKGIIGVLINIATLLYFVFL